MNWDGLPKVMERLNKLLTLARSKGGNDHERAVAGEAARKLMAEHGLTEEDVKADKVVEHVVPGHKWPVWKLAVLYACAKCCACLLIRRRTDQSSSCKLIGRQARVDESRYLYELIASLIKEEASTYPFREKESLDSFKRGMSKAVMDRLEIADFARREKDDGVEKYVAHQHAGASKMEPPPGAASPHAFADGLAAGMNLNLPDPRKPSDNKLIAQTTRVQ